MRLDQKVPNILPTKPKEGGEKQKKRDDSLICNLDSLTTNSPFVWDKYNHIELHEADGPARKRIYFGRDKRVKGRTLLPKTNILTGRMDNPKSIDSADSDDEVFFSSNSSTGCLLYTSPSPRDS